MENQNDKLQELNIEDLTPLLGKQIIVSVYRQTKEDVWTSKPVAQVMDTLVGVEFQPQNRFTLRFSSSTPIRGDLRSYVDIKLVNAIEEENARFLGLRNPNRVAPQVTRFQAIMEAWFYGEPIPMEVRGEDNGTETGIRFTLPEEHRGMIMEMLSKGFVKFGLVPVASYPEKGTKI